MDKEQVNKAVEQLAQHCIAHTVIPWSSPSGRQEYYDIEVAGERFSGWREFARWLKSTQSVQTEEGGRQKRKSPRISSHFQKKLDTLLPEEEHERDETF
jgi:hypothetical protein